MADISSQLGWTEAQWEKVNNAVTEAFAKASVASAFLPCYGPLADSAEYVRDENFTATGATVSVADNTTLRLFNLTVAVNLSSEQVADDALASALLAFRRAASALAQVEDDLVFNGHGQPRVRAQNFFATFPQLYGVSSIPSVAPFLPGVVRPGAPALAGLIQVVPRVQATADQIVMSVANLAGRPLGTTPGDHLVVEIAQAVVELESTFHTGPFACVLGATAFAEAHRPAAGLVLPADRITPILNGPLLRSGRMERNQGIVVSLATNSIDIVVATPPKAQFLQVDPNARYLFRVYEKFIWRIKDDVQPAVRGISI